MKIKGHILFQVDIYVLVIEKNVGVFKPINKKNCNFGIIPRREIFWFVQTTIGHLMGPLYVIYDFLKFSRTQKL